MDLLELFFIIALLLGVGWGGCGLATFLIARSRGGPPLNWAISGFLLGPIGLLLVLKMTRRCPHCQVKVLHGLRSCPSCSQNIPQLNTEQNPQGSLWSYRRNW